MFPPLGYWTVVVGSNLRAASSLESVCPRSLAIWTVANLGKVFVWVDRCERRFWVKEAKEQTEERRRRTQAPEAALACPGEGAWSAGCGKQVVEPAPVAESAAPVVRVFDCTDPVVHVHPETDAISSSL